MAVPPLDFTKLEGKLINMDGANPNVTLSDNRYIGLYFSAHWCPPCRAFTPVLAEYYQEKSKQEGKEFEIVFVSSDNDEIAFQDYFAEMPWFALDYDEDEMKDDLSTRYDIQGIPTLVILKPDGSLLSKNGREIVAGRKDFKDLEA